MVAPAIVGRIIPVVVAALTNQPDFYVISGQFVASGIGHHDFKFGRAVAVGLRLALVGFVVVVIAACTAAEQRTHAGQVLGRPDRLHQTTGDRTPAGLLQAGLQNQLQWRFGLRPFALHGKRRVAFGVKRNRLQLQVMLEVFFGDRTELIARQFRHGFAQRTHVDLTGQGIARGGRAVQVATSDIELGVVSRRNRRVAALEFQSQALGQEVFNLEFVKLRFAVAQVEHQLPATGRRFIGELQLILVEPTAVGFPDELAADLIIRAAHFDGDGLLLDVLAVAVTQQAVEQHGFTGAIQVTRAENEELQRVSLRAGDVELGQVQRRTVQTQHAGLFVLVRQYHRRLGWQRQLSVAVAVGLALGDNLAAVVVHIDAHIAQGLAALERLSEDVQTVAVTVYRQTDITEGEQGSRLRVAVGPRRAHDCQINTRLLQRFDTGNR
ncbi:hypothetical protein ALP17_05449 [Pseudomonas savastanoi]|uniref:Uncharacterized protein n=1 Tax=Pseudomonas savastanoi TaxID=29438 RepID=A0A3M6A5H4_PSESS|nr:hypothetical protein ALP17_05449 [Pseudomonas savastanoi]